MHQFSYQPKSIVAVYSTHDQAEAAASNLATSGYSRSQLNVIGRNYQPDHDVVHSPSRGELVSSWAKLGAFWGVGAGFVLGVLAMFFSGFSSYLVGPLWGGFVGAALGAVGALARETHPVNAAQPEVLNGSHEASAKELANLGVPFSSATEYESVINRGSFLVVVHGTDSEMEEAVEQLVKSPANQVDAYSTGFRERIRTS